MDPTRENKARPELQDFLTTFEDLSIEDQAIALQRILRKRRGESTAGSSRDNTSVLSTPLNAHTCHICKQLEIIHVPKDDRTLEDIDAPDKDRPVNYSEKLVLTKETLQQGSSQQCLLVEWILMLLGRGLRDLDSELTSRFAFQSEFEISRDASDKLQYIAHQGVVLDFQGYADDEIIIKFTFQLEPFLVDKMWEVARDLRKGRTFEEFEHAYTKMGIDRFRMTAAIDDPAAAIIQSRPVNQRMSPENSLQLARRFLDTCQETHKRCHKRATVLPSRVIDVGTKLPIRYVRLHWSEENESGQYAALSYCWGRNQSLTTTSHTAQDMTDGLLFSRLPKTLQDAMTVTANLGLRYIWIDSLCIIQDDPEDLSREIANMANTFQGAFVTISAASACSVDQGFLLDRETLPRPRVALPWRSANTEHGTVLIERERQAYDPSEDPINLRAWTLQEHILPSRTLIFGTRELWWTCETTVSFDALPTNQIENVPAIQQKSSEGRFSLGHWRSIVRDYTRRFLTYPTDKLSGLAGVASLYSQYFESRYLAGLWEVSLLTELMWCSSRPDITRPLVRRAPTWSWASVDGEINHDWCHLTIGTYAPRIAACHVSPVSDSSPFGSIDPTRCELRIECNLIKVSWESDGQYIVTLSRVNTQTGEYEADYRRVGRTLADAFEEHPPEDVWVLPITMDPVRGLLLAHVLGHVYRRVGIVTRLWDDAILSQESARQIISII